MSLQKRTNAFVFMIRFISLVISTFAVLSLLSIIILMTVSTISLRFILLGFGMVLVGLTLLIWQLTSTEMKSRRRPCSVHLHAYRRTNSFAYQMYLEPNFIESAPVNANCYPRIPPPDYEPYFLQMPSMEHDMPPPIYASNESGRCFPSNSPPPRYGHSSLLQVQPLSLGSLERESLYPVIDCSKAEPKLVQWCQNTTPL